MTSEIEIAEYTGRPSHLYDLWREVAAERPWETTMDPAQFASKYLDDPFSRKGFILSILAKGTPRAAALVSLSPEMRRAWLRLWVLPSMRGKGLGTRLLDGSIDRLKTKGKWRLECEIVPFCPGHASFFRKRGFAPDIDYPGGYLMRRSLKDTPVPGNKCEHAILRLVGADISGYLESVANIRIGGENGAGSIPLQERVRELASSMADAKASCYSLAVDGDDAIGYSRSAIVQNVAGELQLRNRGLVVSPEHRGGGLGRALLDDNLAWGYEAGARVAFISTHSKNPAKRLYERAGYEVVEMLENLVLPLS